MFKTFNKIIFNNKCCQLSVSTYAYVHAHILKVRDSVDQHLLLTVGCTLSIFFTLFFLNNSLVHNSCDLYVTRNVCSSFLPV